MQKTRRPRAIRSLRHIPQVHDVLEQRELLTTFPLNGTFSGSYSVMVVRRQRPGTDGIRDDHPYDQHELRR